MKENDEYYYILSQYSNNKMEKLYKSEEQAGQKILFKNALFTTKNLDLKFAEQIYLIEIFDSYGGIKGHSSFSIRDLKKKNYSVSIIAGEYENKNTKAISSQKTNAHSILKDSSKITRSDLIENIKKLNKNNEKTIGKANIDFKEQYYLNYLDLLFDCLKFNITFAIDFTLSNGIPSEKSSLHYISVEPNKYELMINAVLNPLQAQSAINTINAFGFGGVPYPDKSKATEFLFPLNGICDNPKVKNKEEVIRVYKDSIRKAKLSAPTNLQQTLRFISSKAQSEIKNEKYYELLVVLIDGDITDMNETLDLVVKSSSLPVSILIIGIGDMQFERMSELGNFKIIYKYIYITETFLLTYIKFLQYHLNLLNFL